MVSPEHQYLFIDLPQKETSAQYPLLCTGTQCCLTKPFFFFFFEMYSNCMRSDFLALKKYINHVTINL